MPHPEDPAMAIEYLEAQLQSVADVRENLLDQVDHLNEQIVRLDRESASLRHAVAVLKKPAEEAVRASLREIMAKAPARAVKQPEMARAG